VTAPNRILLIGMMGAGKSTTGHLLAARLGWPFVDSDDEVIRLTGRSVPEIWKEDGEAAFRAQESQVLAAVISSDGPVVVGVAGGAVLDPANQARIQKAGLVVWLRADAAALAARVGDGAGRPLLEGGAADALRRLSAARAPIYADLADLTFDVDQLSPPQVVDRIVSALHDRCAREPTDA
jgi:shikimate kinase